MKMPRHPKKARDAPESARPPPRTIDQLVPLCCVMRGRWIGLVLRSVKTDFRPMNQGSIRAANVHQCTIRDRTACPTVAAPLLAWAPQMVR